MRGRACSSGTSAGDCPADAAATEPPTPGARAVAAAASCGIAAADAAAGQRARIAARKALSEGTSGGGRGGEAKVRGAGATAEAVVSEPMEDARGGSASERIGLIGGRAGATEASAEEKRGEKK